MAHITALAQRNDSLLLKSLLRLAKKQTYLQPFQAVCFLYYPNKDYTILKPYHNTCQHHVS